jgi:hypothetical protein
MKYLKLFELFNTAYDYKLVKDNTKRDYPPLYDLTYEFTTKDNVTYIVYLWILNGVCKLDFETKSLLKKHTSKSGKIGIYDGFKVFNTIKNIIYDNKHLMKKIIIEANRKERLDFYIKLIDYMDLKWIKSEIKKNMIIVLI